MLFFAFAWVARSEALKCEICGQAILGNFYWVEDRVEHKTKKLCEACKNIEARCSLCGMPVREGYKHLLDGRYLCSRELTSVIESDTEAKQICSGVKDDLDRLLSRFLTMPGDNVQLSIVDKYHLENLFHAPGMENSCVSIFGATTSRSLPSGKFVHTVDVLSYMQRPHLMAVCAHEYTHAWMGENVKQARKISLDKNTVEGFCELVAYKYMESRHEEAEMDYLKRNNYTVGQIQVLIAADSQYGFNTVMDWIKDGEDTTVNLASLDRIRVLRDGTTSVAATTAAPALIYASAAAPTPGPDTLVLKGISGTGQHRFALINNTTFEALEKSKVRLGQTNVTVQCLEIRNDSVMIQINGTAEKKQLFLRTGQ